MSEWLETNGAGSFCCSTDTERNDRKYHGLLISPLTRKEGRCHILSALNSFALDGSGLETGSNNYPDAVYPHGADSILKQDMLPWPSWIYSRNGTSVQKEIFMLESEKAVWIVFTLTEGGQEVDFDLKFLFTFRNYHELTKANNSLNTEIRKNEHLMKISPYEGMPDAVISFSGEWQHTGDFYWDYNVCYDMEKERGQEWVEDRFVPGNVKIKLKKNIPFAVRVAVCESNSDVWPKDMLKLYSDEKTHRGNEIPSSDDAYEILKYQSRHFILKNPGGKKSINAGYPWFGEWGRDTMLSLPGLTFCLNKNETGTDILKDYASMIKNGLLPNTLGETQGFTSYNTIDAGLLYCWAVNKSMDFGFGKTDQESNILKKIIYKAVKEIVYAFLDNRVPNAHFHENGLISSGTAETQLTWMDATAWGHPVTPRYGYAVELNALWYDSLYLYRDLSLKFGFEVPKTIDSLIKKIPEEFGKTFLIKGKNYLSDTVNDSGQDCKIRPNMLFASSSKPGLLTKEQRRGIVATVFEHLLSQAGVRTLAPEDPDFKPRYEGNPDERDSRYHQGTVWPWLTGILVESDFLTSDDLVKTAKFWSDYLSVFLDKHLFNQGWGFISEVFDAVEPDQGKGTFAQAWSSSEIIRASEIIDRMKINE